jgi:ribosome recycling factor
MIKNILKNTEEKMKHCIGNIEHEFSVIRTGKASPSILDNVRVSYYGTPTAINHLASVTADAGLITVKPWDKSVINEVKNEILKAGLGLVPSVEGDLVKIPIPPLSHERRQELIKIVHRVAEEARVSIRNQRRDAKEEIEKSEKGEHLSEDDVKRGLKELDQLTSDYVEKINKVLAEKEKEIETV